VALLSVVAALFLGLPVIILTLRGVLTRGWEGLPGTGVSEAIVLSILTTILTTIVTLILGTPLAYVLARRRFPLRGLLNVLIELPIVLPPAVAGLALLVTLGRRGALGGALGALGVSLPFTTAAVIVAQCFVSAPFYIRSAIIGFQSVPKEIEDAGRVDGAAGWALFRYLTLPLSLRSLAGGLTLSWTRALGEFGATILFAGSITGRTQTMPLLVYNVLERSIDAAIWTSLILLALAFLALILSRWLTGGASTNEFTDN
jgi:molybdate transport system permease protein